MTKITLKNVKDVSTLTSLARAELHQIAEREAQSAKAIAAERATVINDTIAAGKRIGLTAGEIKTLLGEILDAAAEAGDLSAASVRSYKASCGFAVDWGVQWSSALSSAEAQEEAIQGLEKAVPKAIKERADKARAKRAPAGAQASGKAHVANVDTYIRQLAAALATARTLGFAEAGDILDLIHQRKPDFTEPKAD